MELAEIHRVSVADQVASILRQRILDGELIPGTALQEVPMAASLGVSRNTVREATRILSLEGLLKRSAHRGVTVAQLSLEDVWVRAVRFDLYFHTLLIRFHRNRRLESFYQKLLGELRMGMVLVDLRHDNPGGLVPVHRRIFELLTGGKTEECASLLAQHLRDSETRLTAVMDQRIARVAK